MALGHLAGFEDQMSCFFPVCGSFCLWSMSESHAAMALEQRTALQLLSRCLSSKARPATEHCSLDCQHCLQRKKWICGIPLILGP